MEQNKNLKLIISYSHRDENPYVEQFKKHIAPLKENGLIKEWYDRKILAGEEYQNEIDNNVESADIICLFISANFLSSEACKKEKKQALELKKKRGISVVPIILSPCGWKDDKKISRLLALPTNGKPISSFPDSNEAWHDVYTGLKKVIEKQMMLMQLKVKEEFRIFLQDTEMLTKAHFQKEKVFLDDIFIYPELVEHSREHKAISSEELVNNILNYTKIAIAGADQSGKTTLCKTIFKELRKKNFVPIYLSDRKNHFKGKIENIILRSFEDQYVGVDIKNIDRERIVPLVDDFHLASNKEKHIKDLSLYPYCIVIVDDIFNLNIKDEKLIGLFDFFRIRELKPSLRYELIKKWVSLSDKEVGDADRRGNQFYKDVDRTIELVDSTLGKIIGRGIMPAYPFFILSTLMTYEAFATPLDQEITSQGYCYQAFIYFYLRKQGVRNDEIDIYINYLTELAFYTYKEKKKELSTEGFTSFMKLYYEKYNLPIEPTVLLGNLGQIISVDGFNNYSFAYTYLYYFFVSKYLAEHIEDGEVGKEIEKIINNLHVNENAYIAVFIAHHSKNIKILEEIELNALFLFDKHSPATLTRDEVEFFGEEVNVIIKAALPPPPPHTTPEKVREERLKIEDGAEQSEEVESAENALGRELRRAIKTMEVMGSIIKNRAGSLERTKLNVIFEEAMNVHLRVLCSFFEIIKSKENQKDIVEMISSGIQKTIAESERKLSRTELERKAKTIFWNINFFVVFGVINKIVHSLGSDKLMEIVNNVCDKINTPASFLVKHGILMWYGKNLQIEDIAEKMKEKDFSVIAERVIKFIVVNHCALHTIGFKERQRIENRLGIEPIRLLQVMKKKE